MTPLVDRALVVATALPASVLAPGAEVVGRPERAAALRRRAGRTSRLVRAATALPWLLVLARGLLYPLAAGDPAASWGGPTLVGAWAAHLAITLAVLAAVSLLVATVARGGPGRERRRPRRGPARGSRRGARDGGRGHRSWWCERPPGHRR